jgi:hypothetical protein
MGSLVCRFWDFRIGRPWEAKEAEALELLHALLNAVAIRHSKSQVRRRWPGRCAGWGGG